MKTKIRSLSLAILTGLAFVVLSLGVFFGVGKPVSAKAVGTGNATWQEIIDNNANKCLTKRDVWCILSLVNQLLIIGGKNHESIHRHGKRRYLFRGVHGL